MPFGGFSAGMLGAGAGASAAQQGQYLNYLNQMQQQQIEQAQIETQLEKLKLVDAMRKQGYTPQQIEQVMASLFGGPAAVGTAPSAATLPPVPFAGSPGAPPAPIPGLPPGATLLSPGRISAPATPGAGAAAPPAAASSGGYGGGPGTPGNAEPPPPPPGYTILGGSGSRGTPGNSGYGGPGGP